jgi:hypothetical protein
MPFLMHNMARPPTDFCGACLRGHRRCKKPDATLSGRTIFLSVKPVLCPSAFFCHISWRQTDCGKTRAKSVKKGRATLSGSTVCAIVLCLQRLRRCLRHVIWPKSAENHVKPQWLLSCHTVHSRSVALGLFPTDAAFALASLRQAFWVQLSTTSA